LHVLFSPYSSFSFQLKVSLHSFIWTPFHTFSSCVRSLTHCFLCLCLFPLLFIPVHFAHPLDTFFLLNSLFFCPTHSFVLVCCSFQAVLLSHLMHTLHVCRRTLFLPTHCSSLDTLSAHPLLHTLTLVCTTYYRSRWFATLPRTVLVSHWFGYVYLHSLRSRWYSFSHFLHMHFGQFIHLLLTFLVSLVSFLHCRFVLTIGSMHISRLLHTPDTFFSHTHILVLWFWTHTNYYAFSGLVHAALADTDATRPDVGRAFHAALAFAWTVHHTGPVSLWTPVALFCVSDAGPAHRLRFVCTTLPRHFFADHAMEHRAPSRVTHADRLYVSLPAFFSLFLPAHHLFHHTHRISVLTCLSHFRAFSVCSGCATIAFRETHTPPYRHGSLLRPRCTTVWDHFLWTLHLVSLRLVHFSLDLDIFLFSHTFLSARTHFHSHISFCSLATAWALSSDGSLGLPLPAWCTLHTSGPLPSHTCLSFASFCFWTFYAIWTPSFV